MSIKKMFSNLVSTKPAARVVPIKVPYLVQRASINRPLNEYRGEKLSSAVNMDYMGSAEFEFGALPKSLRALESSVDLVKLTIDDRIVDNDRPVRVLHTLEPEEFEKYMGFLLRMRSGDIRMKELSYFEPNQKFNRADFWWDVENNVMWSFDKEFMNRLGDHLVASWKYMNDK